MGTATITIPLDETLAEVYNTASEEDRAKIQFLLSMWLRAFATTDQVPLNDLMDTISDKAQAGGLTADDLESLLNDDE